MNTEYRVYNAFFESKKTTLYFNELVDLTKLSHSSLQKTLGNLVESKVVSTEKSKAHRFYNVKNKRIFALKFAELVQFRFENLNSNIRIPLENFVDKIPRNILCVVLFGSTSRGTQNKNSDIDLLIVSSVKQNFSEITRKINAISKYPLSISECSMEDFLKNNDHLIIQAKQTGFPIFGEQFFYEAELDEYKRVI